MLAVLAQGFEFRFQKFPVHFVFCFAVGALGCRGFRAQAMSFEVSNCDCKTFDCNSCL